MDPNIIIVLVEGDSEQISLELPLSNIIYDKYPDSQVRFLQQYGWYDQNGDEEDDCIESDEEDNEISEQYIEVEEREPGGDITASRYVNPANIETKIMSRFIKPAIKKEGIYPKKIARIIHIVDLDGTYIPDENIIRFSEKHQNREKLYYDGEKGLIEGPDVTAIIKRNKQKRDNLEYLQHLPNQKIRIKNKNIPYEIYYFSSNLDHFLHNEANPEYSKRYMANKFFKEYGYDDEKFRRFFFEDKGAIGYMGYEESWEFIKQDFNSVKRFTNIDCLIRRLLNE